MAELEFEWDEAKAAANVRKHAVTFHEASSVFRDPLAKVLPDPTEPAGEDRAIIMGHSDRDRLLLVVLTGSESSALGWRPDTNANSMKNTRSRRSEPGPEDMPSEYELDWSKAKPNPNAARLKDTVAIVLAPDVARVFPPSESVNTALRSVIAAVPRRAKVRSSRSRRKH